MLSIISLENAEGFCLNFCLQFFSRHSSASRTWSGFSNFVSAARRRSSLASWTSLSVIVAVDDWKMAEFGRTRLRVCVLEMVPEVGANAVDEAPIEAATRRERYDFIVLVHLMLSC